MKHSKTKLPVNTVLDKNAALVQEIEDLEQRLKDQAEHHVRLVQNLNIQIELLTNIRALEHLTSPLSVSIFESPEILREIQADAIVDALTKVKSWWCDEDDDIVMSLRDLKEYAENLRAITL